MSFSVFFKGPEEPFKSSLDAFLDNVAWGWELVYVGVHLARKRYRKVPGTWKTFLQKVTSFQRTALSILKKSM